MLGYMRILWGGWMEMTPETPIIVTLVVVGLIIFFVLFLWLTDTDDYTG